MRDETFKADRDCKPNIRTNNGRDRLRWNGSYGYLTPDIEQVQDQAGNASGAEPIAGPTNYRAGTPVWLPVATYADTNKQGLSFIIVDFACVMPDQVGTSGPPGWDGTVLDLTDPVCEENPVFHTGAGEAPNAMPEYTVRMVELQGASLKA